MNDLRERIKEARELCNLPGSYGTLAVVRRKLDEMLSVPEAKPREVRERIKEADDNTWYHVGDMSDTGWYEGCQTVADPASDTAPDLRERVEALTWALTALETEEFVRPGPPIVVLRKMRDELDAVLSTLGEPK